MENVVYTTNKKDFWTVDSKDLVGTLKVFWLPYKFEVRQKDEEVDIIAMDDRFEPTEGAISLFNNVCGVITVSIQMWIEGYSVGRYKTRI